MKALHANKSLSAVLALALLAACGGGGAAAMPSAASASLGQQNRVGKAHALRLSGEYVGKFNDGAYGAGKAKASYSQSQSSVGGTLTVKYAHSTIALSVALVADGSSVDGTSVAGTGSLYCTFATTSTYDAKTHVMSGTYSAVYGCSGDGGTFRLKQKCYYKHATNDVLPAVGPKPC